MRFIYFVILTICISVLCVSCKKDKLLTDSSANLKFSQDSVLFDTVFTTIGSTTRSFRVINEYNQRINISSVRLEKGQASNFIINVDGLKGKEVKDVEILGKDSIYIFVQVNVNPTSQNSPLIIQDKILFEVNGKTQSVELEAWGQDAYYHFPDRAIQFKNGYFPYSLASSATNTTVTWSNDKPHVIYGWLVVDSTQTLIINPGVKIFMHQNAGMWVYRYGTLQINGSLGNEVVFQGDRRESDYLDEPGQWDRIWINEGSVNNRINYAVIKNAFIGIQAEIVANASQPKRLHISNTVIRNCSKWGMYCKAFNVFGVNNEISNCKEYCTVLAWGGKYTFLHTTFANHFNKDGGRGGQSTIHLDNFDGQDYWPLDSAYFGNCIIDGTLNNELEIDVKPASPFTKNYFFNSCLIKNAALTSSVSANCLYNQSPRFKDVSIYDFKINSDSKAIGIGDASLLGTFPIISNDKNGVSRTTVFDAGANQFQ
jgi:hypothetical protein